MRPTRRLWGTAGLAVFLAGLAVVLARPVLLAGSALVGAWLCAQLDRFRRDLTRATDALTIVQAPTQTAVRTGETVPVTLAVSCETASPPALEVSAGLPMAAHADAPVTLDLEPGAGEAKLTVDVTWPVAGRHEFNTATITASNGLVRETITAGDTPTITVEPRGPRQIHVGEGGDRVRTAYGDHDAEQYGVGLEPAEIREYVPGDTADRIDWKATARLADLHVREYEAETDRRILLVVDHRHTLATGTPAETQLDYLREVALATVASARGDAVGLITIGDNGITNRIDATTSPGVHAAIRRTLLELAPTADMAPTGDDSVEASDDSPAARHAHHAGPRLPPRRRRATPRDARHALAPLDGDTDSFATTLRPFYAAQRVYQEQLDETPLYGAVRRALARTQGPVQTILFTDDRQPAELRETVQLAARQGNAVTALLAPSVLYEPGGLADVQQAYDRYVAFEELRRALAKVDRATALEVGPGDRLATVLSAGRSAARPHRGERA